MRNKRGDIQSIIFAIAVIAAIGFVLFFFSMIFDKMYETLEDELEDNPDYNDTQAVDTLESIRGVEQSVWDYAFLAIAVFYVIAVGIFGFSQRTSPVFFWISVILSILGLFIGVALGSVWQEMAANTDPTMVAAVARFPIMDKLLGTYYPTFVTFIILVGLVTLYGKPVGGISR